MSGELAKALAAFQAAMPTVTKNKTANTGTYTYKYADLADVASAAMPLLAQNGLAFAATPERTDTGYVLVGHLMHESGEEITGALPLSGGSPQQMGSALTYMRRYLLGCLTGIVTDDDDDGRAAQQQSEARTSRTRPTEPPADEWTTPATDAHTARVELGAWVTANGLDPQEAVTRWAAEHDGQHIKDATDGAAIRDMGAAWAVEIEQQRSAEA